jgi:molybdate transport system substrate-binding protein
MSGREGGEETVSPAEFAAAPFDMVEDLCGDPGADLVVFFAGNQYMVVPDLVEGFLAAQPSAGSVFYETLPPGVIAAQLRAGGLRMGSLVLRVRPDVMASGPAALA